MTAYSHMPAPICRSRLSFQPLLEQWKIIADTTAGMQAHICAHLVKRFSKVPELLQPIDDYSVLTQHQDLIEEGMATIFPVALNQQLHQFAAAVPFSQKVVYASPLFKTLYVDEENDYVKALDAQVERNIESAKVNLAYKLILKKFYDIDLPGGYAFICAYPDPAENIYNYFELEWDTQFIDVTTNEGLPSLPDAIATTCRHANDLVRYPQLLEVLPLEQFLFDGFIIIRIHEVTEREATNRIRTLLEEGNLLEDAALMKELQQQIRYFLHMPELEIGVTSYHKHDISLTQINDSSLLMQNMEGEDKMTFCKLLAQKLQTTSYYRCTAHHPQKDMDDPLSAFLEKTPWKNVLILALYDSDELIGWMEVCSSNILPIHIGIVDKLQRIIDLLEIAVQKNQQQVQQLLDKVIKEHFTAVQSSVEWKFKEAAFAYITRHKEADAKMEPIVFDQVYPLYGIIDIRNSSGERNKALQQDILSQLQWIKRIVNAAHQFSFPILKEIELRVDEYIATVNNFLFAGDEHTIQSFLKREAEDLLKNLKEVHPPIERDIDAYLEATSNRRHMIVTHQEKYEQSVTEINNLVTKLLEKEQQDAQGIYPHYFERFVTDGVDFNMYIGQSIVPAKPFNKLYLRNLRLWQLHFLAQAARQVHKHTPRLPVVLETTQLILVYTDPLSISFRTAERKFDVDGVYNVRYEVVKKRIDKALIKGTNERLTQPGTIAIVYANDSEAKEYMQYINFLKKQALLEGEVEWLELEDLQGVSGLKALRVPVQLEKKEAPGKRKQVYASE